MTAINVIEYFDCRVYVMYKAVGRAHLLNNRRLKMSLNNADNIIFFW